MPNDKNELDELLPAEEDDDEEILDPGDDLFDQSLERDL